MFNFFILIFFIFSQFALTENIFALEKKSYSNSTEKLFVTNKLTFNLFIKEFVQTRSLKDFYRSYKRIKIKSLINTENDKNNELIFSYLKPNEISEINNLISKISYQALLKSKGKKNRFYSNLNLLIIDINKINVLAEYEIKFVEELRKISEDHAFSKNNHYYKYLIDHARYEIFINYFINN